ncbi:mycobacterial cell wall arabinan synthesis family protein [Mycobacterium xenopi 3993]|nr:mycobacterial cell wall arabinan synthesis family protein [Mycobacterium xenopi 3993]
MFGRTGGGHQPPAAGGDRLHHRRADLVFRAHRNRLDRALLVAIGPLRTIVHRRSERFGHCRCWPDTGRGHSHDHPDLPRPDLRRRTASQHAQTRRRAQPELVRRAHPLRAAVHGQPDGSVARRFAVLALLVALAVSVAMSLRKGRIPGTAAGPSRRIIGITIISFIAMMFTPTKWTHHFGVFAGLAGSLGALAAVAVTSAAMRSRRNRTMFAALVLFVMALSFASVNGWWYVSNFGVPWSNSFPSGSSVLLPCCWGSRCWCYWPRHGSTSSTTA